jgi:hypothetical protein
VEGVRVAILAESGSPAAAFLAALRPDRVFLKPVDPEHVCRSCEVLINGEAGIAGRTV